MGGGDGTLFQKPVCQSLFEGDRSSSLFVVASEERMNAVLRAFASALLLVVPQSASLSAQSRTQVGLGIGMGPTSAPGTPAAVISADAKWTIATPWKLGAELWWAFNHDRVCLEAPSNACTLAFPVLVGVAPTISVGFGGDLIEFGMGPGLFERYFSNDDKALVGGAAAHVHAAIVRSHYVNVLLSVRPFVGARANRGATWAVPIMLGLSR